MSDTIPENNKHRSIVNAMLKITMLLLLVTLVTTQLLILSSLKNIRYSIPMTPPSRTVYSVEVINSDRNPIPIEGSVEIDTLSSINGDFRERPVPVTIKSYSGFGGALPVEVR
jgi:hypothetical protein